jgi:hypothetical protein
VRSTRCEASHYVIFSNFLPFYSAQIFTAPCSQTTSVCSSLSLVSFLGAVRLSPLSTSTTNWPIIPVPDDDKFVAVGGMTGRGNRTTRRKLAPLLLCPPQIPYDLTWATAVGSWQRSARALAQHLCCSFNVRDLSHPCRIMGKIIVSYF